VGLYLPGGKKGLERVKEAGQEVQQGREKAIYPT